MFVSEKLTKALGPSTLEELEAMNDEELKKVVLDASAAMKQVKDELEANAKYQDLKEDLKAITQGKRDVDKRQKARIQYSLTRLTEIGKMSLTERFDWQETVRKNRLALEAKKRKDAEAVAREKAKQEAAEAAEEEADEE